MKDNLEKEIKQQVENRMIPPSEQVWMKISEALNQGKSVKKNHYLPWIGGSVAAAIVLIFLLVLNNKKSPIRSFAKIPIAMSKPVTAQNIATTPEFESKKPSSQSAFKTKVHKENSLSPIPIELESNPLIANSERPEIKTVQKEHQKELAIIAKASGGDTISKKDGRYVDPQMLLFSIEHDQAIKKKNAKKGTLVIVDFNKEK